MTTPSSTTSRVTGQHATARSAVGFGLFLLRLATGLTLAAHGAQKVFVMGFAGVTGGFTKMGVPLPGIAGPAVSLLELVGGIMLAVGLLTRLVGLGLALDMLGAILLVHLKNGFFAPGGIEFVMMLGVASLCFAIDGAGPYSVDAMLAERRGHR
jgi:putative oxidoreductase